MYITFEFATRDDCLDKMVPSDLRQLVSDRDALLEQVADLTRKLNLRQRVGHMDDIQKAVPHPEIKLLPCPNCGNHEDISYNCYTMAEVNGITFYEAETQCLACDLQTGSSANTVCPCISRYEAKKAAADIWNGFAERMEHRKKLVEAPWRCDVCGNFVTNEDAYL